MIYISLFLLAIYSNCFSFLMHFLFFKLIYLNWRIITLQYCDSLCHTSTWIGHRYTSVPSLLNTRLQPSPPAPSRLSQSTSSGFPASYIKLPLVVLHVVMYMFQWYSLKSSHPLLSHWVQRSVLYVCVSFAALHIGSSVPSFQILYICVKIWYLSFSSWCASFCVIGSRFIHLIRTDSNTFLLIAE